LKKLPKNKGKLTTEIRCDKKSIHLTVKESNPIKSIALLLQAIAVILILLGSYPKHSSLKGQASHPTFLCLAAGATLVSRETPNHSFLQFSILKGNLFQSELWKLISWAYTAESIANFALDTPPSLYNTYYTLLRIHAP